MERARKRAETARRYHLKALHAMTPEQYNELLEFQGGTCFICQRAKGTKGAGRSLAVDHDHAIAREACAHEPVQSCSDCWRGLLCQRCNGIFAHLRDDPMAFERALDYLKQPPARRLWQRPLRMMRRAS